MTNNELYHHGVLGMKWGVRRYQNKDGSLTKSGKSRYSDSKTAKSDYKKAKENYRDTSGSLYGPLGVRLTVTKNQRKQYAKDVKENLANREKYTNAKYEYKISKAQEKGKNNKVAKLRAKQESKMAEMKARNKITNKYFENEYAKKSAGKAILDSIKHKFTLDTQAVNTLKSTGYGKARTYNLLYGSQATYQKAANVAGKNARKQVAEQWEKKYRD